MHQITDVDTQNEYLYMNIFIYIRVQGEDASDS